MCYVTIPCNQVLINKAFHMLHMLFKLQQVIGVLCKVPSLFMIFTGKQFN